MNSTIYTKGTIQYSNGNFYDGESLGGKPHGKGTMKFADGMQFFGDWQYGYPVKENGVIVLMDGKIIEDNIYNDQTSFLSNHATHLQCIKIKPTEEQLKRETNTGKYCPYSFRVPASYHMPNLQIANLNNSSSQSAISSPRSSIPNANSTTQHRQSQEERKSPAR
jgi:hypothetical protein